MSITRDSFAKAVFFSCTLLSAGLTIAVFLFMLALGLPLLRGGSFFGVLAGPWAPQQGLFGIYPMVLGTLAIALTATAVALPLSLGASFVLAGLGGPSARRVLNALIRFMTGIPTVIYGFVGIFLLIPLVRSGLGGSGLCVLSASLMLAVLVSPTMILFFSDSLLAVPRSHVQAARALGASRVQRLLYVMLPRALPGMGTGLVLALGRAVGDTLIALMLAGNAISPPGGLLDPARTLTAHIALVKAADTQSLEFCSIFACGIALYIFTAAAVLCIRVLGRAGRRAA